MASSPADLAQGGEKPQYPPPEELGLTTDESPEVKKYPPPEELGLTTDTPSTPSGPKYPSPEELGLTTDSDRGPVGRVWDAYTGGTQSLANKLHAGWDAVKEEFAADHPIGGMIQKAEESLPFIDDVSAAVKSGTTKAFGGLGEVLQMSNRIGGTAIADVVDPVAKLLNLDSINLMANARQRDLQEGLTKPNELSFDSVFPVRLLEDVGVPLGQKPVEIFGDYLQTSGSKNIKEIGEVISGLAPGVGMGTGILASLELDPLSITKFGILTEAGIAAEKAGQLETGIARQVENSQRNIMEFRLGGIVHPEVSLGGTTFGTVGPKIINKASNVMAMAEMAHLPNVVKTYGDIYPLQWVRNFMSRSSLIGVNNLVEQRMIEDHGVEFAQSRLYDGAVAKAGSLGLDLESPAVKKDIYNFFDNPTQYRGAVGKEKIAPLFDYLNQELKNEVDLTRAVGIPVPEKAFSGYSEAELFQMKNSNMTAAKNLEQQLADESLNETTREHIKNTVDRLRQEAQNMGNAQDFSERYVPRGVSPSKRQAYLAAKQVKDVQEGAQILEDLEGLQVGRGAKSDSFQRLRSMKTREAMNAEIEAQTGVKEFFHDNPIQAYGDKIAELKRARMDKKFVSGILGEFGTTDAGYVQSIVNSKARVDWAELKGFAPNHDDLIMSKVDPGDVTTLARLPEDARMRLRAIARLSPELEGAENVKLPGIVGDYVGSVLSRPTDGAIKGSLLAFQNLTKSAMFANPGFLLRHAWRMVGRGMAVDVGVADNIKSFLGIVKGEGDWAERLPDFFERSKALGLASPTELQAESASQGLYETALKNSPKIEVNSELLSQPHSLSQAQSAIREMGASGKFKGFLSDLRSSMRDGVLDPKSVIRNNPVFRLSSMLTQNAELMPKFAYFNKLIDDGYTADLAMQKTNRIFMNFEQIRNSTRSASTIVPFANFMVKNTETLFEVMAQNPRNFAALGRNGAFQRALENWGGWNPEKTNSYREEFGVWANDWILLPVMPGHDAIMSEKDWLKQTMFKWFAQDKPDAEGKPINQLEGAQLWLRLPSNSHALSIMNPLNLADEMGPMVKAALALVTGNDPFTNAPIPGNGTDAQWRERGKVAMQHLSEPFAPMTTINAARGIVSQLWPSYEKSLMNMGFPEGMLKSIFGDRTNMEVNKRISKSLSVIKSLWLGGAKQMDLDMFFRTEAELHRSSKYLKYVFSQLPYGKRGSADVKAGVNVLMNSVKRMGHMMDVKNDYDAAIRKAGSPTTQVVLDEDTVKSDTNFSPPEDTKVGDTDTGDDPHS